MWRRRRRVQIDFDELLDYPLLDFDGRIYTGPDHLPPLSESLKEALREL